MESSNTECGVCFYSYDEKERRPLVLQCSHSFCQACLEKMAASNNKVCSLCRESWDKVHVKDLLCCYQLIPSQPGQGQPSTKEDGSQKCPEHPATDFSLWCESCEVLICVKCLRLAHKGCQWILLEEKCDKSLKLCEGLQSELTALVPRNVMALQLVERCMGNLHTLRDDLVTWQLSVEKELSDLPSFDGVAQSARDATELHKKAMILSSVRRKVPVERAAVHILLGNASQVTEDIDAGGFLSNFAPLADLALVDGTSAAPSAPSLGDVASLSEEGPASLQDVGSLPKGGAWTISDLPTVTDACRGLRLYLIPPASVKIKWSFGDKQEILDLLSLVKMTPCLVTLRLLDCFLVPVPRALSAVGDKRSLKLNSTINVEGEQLPTPPLRTLQATHSRINALLIPDHRCVLTEFCGHLDAEALQKLPKTLKTLGLALADKEDMSTLKLLVEVDRNSWVLKEEWSFLSNLHLSFVRSFQSGFWSLDKKKAHGNSEFSSYVTEGLELSLHFPKLDSKSLSWFKRILVKLTGHAKDKSFVKSMFFFGFELSADKLRSVLKDCKLENVALHHPQETLSRENRQEADALQTEL